MPTIRELIEALPCLTSKQHSKCRGCPFNPHPGAEWVYGCWRGQNDMLDMVIRILKGMVEK